MSGNRNTGLKARDKNLARDPDFYKRIGSKGGSKTGIKGFAVNRDLARAAGIKGGIASGISKRAAIMRAIEANKDKPIE